MMVEQQNNAMEYNRWYKPIYPHHALVLSQLSMCRAVLQVVQNVQMFQGQLATLQLFRVISNVSFLKRVERENYITVCQDSEALVL